MKLLLSFYISVFALNAQTERINKIVIEHVEYDLETVYKINCQDFEKRFGSSIHKHVLTQMTDINKFYEFEKKVKINKKKYHPDVRVKIILYKENGTKDVLCTDGGNSAELNGTPVLISDEFANYIKKVQ